MMIAQTFDEVFSSQWINTYLSYPYPVTGSQSRSCLVCRGALFVNIFRWTGQLGFRYKLGLAPFSVRLSCLERS